MQIHVVRPGQTLWQIAQAFGVGPQELIAANDLPNPGQLIPGQALVIPIRGRYHWVSPGESPWSIARQYGITLEQLLAVNRIPNPTAIQVGTRLYIPQGPRPTIEANAYIEPRGQEQERADMAAVADDLTYATMFSYRVNAEGGITPLNDAAARAGARSGDAAPLMAITNIGEGEQFSAELGEAILGSTQVQDRLFENAIRIMRERGFRGINIDFERLRPEDREAYNQFLRRAVERFHAEGFIVSTALAPKITREQRGAWYEAHDYRAHGEIVDFSVIMTYEWGWSGGPPMAVAPLNQVARVLRYALTEMPANKILMGAPLYGYDWTLPYVQGGPFARALSPQDAIALAAREGVPAIQFDRESQAPWFRYQDDQGRTHEVWFEDARSIQARFNLVKSLGLRGVSYWKLPFEFPQNWLLLQDNFRVRKLS